MKVVCNSADELVLESRPRAIPAFCYTLAAAFAWGIVTRWGGTGLGELALLLLFCAISLLGGLVFSIRSRMRFDASARGVSWQQRGPFGIAEQRGSASFDSIRDVGVEELADREEKGARVVLFLKGRSVPLTPVFSAIGWHERNASQVREWLERAGVELQSPCAPELRRDGPPG